MTTLALMVVVGLVLIGAALLDRRGVLPHGTDREGLFDNVYTFWVLGVAWILFGVGTIAVQREVEWLANLTVLPALAIGLYGAYCIIRRPRWMWPAWRHEMERRQQEREAAARIRGEEGRG